MNELDLDELDQAVSAMMDGKKAKKPVRQPAEPVRLPPARPPLAKGEDRVQVTVNRPLPKLPQRARVRGAAMDIVQPKVSPKVAPPSAKPARTAAALKPTKPIIDEPSSLPEVPVNKSEPKPKVDLDSKVTSEDFFRKPAENSWPDPLDFHNFKADQKREEKPPVEMTPHAPAPTMSSPTSEPEPTATPFLTTKVEKRPLGAYAETKIPDVPQEHEDKIDKDDLVEPPKPKEPIEPKLTPPPAEQPKELSPEVVAVESTETKMPEEPEAETEIKQTSPADLRQMTIPQQYRAEQHQPSSHERPVFDTKEYHAPAEPVHTAHRTGSAWGWVLIAVLVLLLIAAGVLAYLAMTGDLSLDISRLL